MLFIYLFIYLSPNNISYKKCYRISRLYTAVGRGVSNTSPLSLTGTKAQPPLI